jgi:hypothetical protein
MQHMHLEAELETGEAGFAFEVIIRPFHRMAAMT